jgi:plastocyanin
MSNNKALILVIGLGLLSTGFILGKGFVNNPILAATYPSTTMSPSSTSSNTSNNANTTQTTTVSGSSATIVYDSTENRFEPENPLVAVNGTVNFVNNTGNDITLSSTGTPAYTPLNVTVPANSSAAVTFSNTGTYHYHVSVSNTSISFTGFVTVEN